MERVLGHAWFKSVIFLICLLVTTQLTSATTLTIPSDDDLIIGARAIITGRVLSIESVFDEKQERIYTYITVKVREVLKGHITERKIVLKELGGQVGETGLTVFGNPQFARGERVLLYLDTWKDGSLRTYQMLLGKFSIEKDKTTGHEFVSRSLKDDNVTVLRPHSHEGQTNGPATERMEFNTYKEMVRTRLAATRRLSKQFERTHYHGIPVLAQPAEYSNVRGRGDIHADWTYINTAHPRWFQPDSGLPVIFEVNPDSAPLPQIADDVTAAMNAWSTIPATSLQLLNGGSSEACFSSSGTNVIIFNGCDGRWSQTQSCQGVLAVGGLSWNGNTTVVNGVVFRQATSGFVSMNPYAACHYTVHCNVREVLTHELGHAVGLGHSADSTATMAAFAHFDGRCASVRPDDMSAIQFIYPGAGGGPPPLSIVTSSLPGGTVGTPYSQALVATGGTPPYNWSLLSGQLPNGLSLSSVGTISGTPTVDGTFTFTVRVTDAASGTAQKALSITVLPPGSAYASDFLSQTVPSTLNAGQTFNATMSWLNTGTQSWIGATGLRLISQNPANNTTWGGNTVLLSSEFVSPGETLEVTFEAVAPTTPGTYNFQWIVARNASNPFGEKSTNFSINVGGGGGTNNASFVTQSVPSSLTVNQSASVSVTFSNTGTSTWTPGTYLLTSLNPQGNSTWGLSQVALTSSVAPGSSKTFNFSITAPSAPGNYNFQWGMLKSGVGVFGTPSTNVSINVTSGGGGSGNQAQFISQTVPATWVAGQTYTVLVRMKNTGTTFWTMSNYKLGSQNPANNINWGLNRVSLTTTVTPGATATFTFNATVPTSPGTYNFQWRMVHGSGTFFGDTSPNIAVVIGGGGGGANNAAFISQSVPSSLTPGQTTSVSVTMSNNGTTTWAAGSYSLQSQNPTGNTTWGLSRVNLASPVAPGSSRTFTFNITAPGAAGTYNFQWRMAQDGVGFFGDLTTNVAINVSQGGTPPTITTTSLPAGARGVPYSKQMNATGGTLPYTWSVSAGSLPPGLALNSSTGLISGTPTLKGARSVTITVTDQNGLTASRGYAVFIN